MSLTANDINNRTTPELISILSDNQIFVFGSNTLGVHGLGAAKDAMNFGARYGVGEGHIGNTYAIPTKGSNFKKSLPLDIIEKHIDKFIKYAKQNNELIFLVTPIGTGLAHYTPYHIAPLFIEATAINNIHLPKIFWKILYKK
jgi:hypothetical protein